ncbi:MAG: hypothetical protein H7332_18255 [Bdellovibrionales bacterium]|nr:hypothetical protein [Ramlibacter sp.]
MSDSENSGFGKFVPGFDFLQSLAKGATQGIPQMPQMPKLGNWIAPTINVEELDKRIDELKAVQFWLDQNATALKATIQALEVQKMTLATLKGMNFNLGDVANAFKLKAADTVFGGVQKVAGRAADAAQAVSAAAANAAEDAADADDGEDEASPAGKRRKKAKAAAPAPGVIDPVQWWGSLTQQFQQIAATAMKEAAKQTAMDTTKNMATGLAKGAFNTATGLAKAAKKSVDDSTRASRAPAKKAAKKSTRRAR